MVIVAVPVTPSTGWMARVCTPALRRMMLPFGTRLVFDELPVTTKPYVGVSGSLKVMLNGPMARPINVVWFGITAIIGGAFPLPTVRTKLSLAELTPSLTVIVIVVVPDCPAFGVTVTVRFVPLPPKTMLLVGTMDVPEEAAVRTRLELAVTGLLIVKGSGPVLVLTGMVWFRDVR